MAKVQEFEIDYGAARQAVKWLNKGAKMTGECKRKEYTCTGRVRKKREIVSTNVIGAIRVGQARATNHREVRIKNERYVGFWLNVLHFIRAYQKKYGVHPVSDNQMNNRQFVINRANNLV